MKNERTLKSLSEAWKVDFRYLRPGTFIMVILSETFIMVILSDQMIF